MKLMIRTHKERALEDAITVLAIQVGFIDPKPGYLNAQFDGILFSSENTNIMWYRGEIVDKQIDAKLASVNTIISELKNVLSKQGHTIPFNIRGEKVTVYPGEKVVVGCETIGSDKMDAIIHAYRKELAL